jgi:succinyl-CoA synthetase alpha subunit
VQSVTLAKKNLYHDSVTLMKLSGQISELPGVIDVLVGMGTDLNKNMLMDIGIMTSESEAAGANDLLIGIRAETEEAVTSALQSIDEIMNKGAEKSVGDRKFETIRQVAALNEGYNLAVVSVPGIYAARECKTALNNDMHVFLFSDNVTIDEEVELKQLANEKNLLLMGPDCGTAIIGGVPLGFANRVRKGNIGIAAASGTGLQHVTTLIDRLGAGISQAIGTGGRDLSERVQGRTMFAALDALDSDADTKVVVILSKPPAPSVADKVLARAKSMSKPVVLCLFGQGPLENPGNIRQCYNIEETAVKAASLALC